MHTLKSFKYGMRRTKRNAIIATLIITILLTSSVFAFIQFENPTNKRDLLLYDSSLTNEQIKIYYTDEAVGIGNYKNDSVLPTGWQLLPSLYWDNNGNTIFEDEEHVASTIYPVIHFTENGQDYHFCPLHQSIMSQQGDAEVIFSGWISEPNIYASQVKDIDELIAMKSTISIFNGNNYFTQTINVTSTTVSTISNIELVLYLGLDINGFFNDYAFIDTDTNNMIKAKDNVTGVWFGAFPLVQADSYEISLWDDGPSENDDLWQHFLTNNINEQQQASGDIEGALLFNLHDLDYGETQSINIYYSFGHNENELYPDTAIPELFDNTPDMCYTGDILSFNATVLDNTEVSSAWIEYWYGTGSHTNLSMDNMGDDYWEKSIIVDDTLETLYYMISANDTSENWNTTGIKDITIYDNDNPIITNIDAHPSSQSQNEYVNITCSVTDNIEIAKVKVNIIYPDFSFVNQTMTIIPSMNTYYYNASYPLNGTYEYSIWTNDTSFNENESILYYFEILPVLDTTPPEIQNVLLHTSDPLDTDPAYGWENFTCTVTDNVDVDEVKLYITGDTATEYLMTKDGDIYYYKVNLSVADRYNYHIWADDSSNNENISNSYPFNLSMNEDVDESGKVHFMDLIAISLEYNNVGPNGWIREDVNNDGKAHFMDLVAVSISYNTEW